jgi:hypothetical protein
MRAGSEIGWGPALALSMGKEDRRCAVSFPSGFCLGLYATRSGFWLCTLESS